MSHLLSNQHPSSRNENAEYRAARNVLLEAEIALRRHLEAAAALRRSRRRLVDPVWGLLDMSREGRGDVVSKLTDQEAVRDVPAPAAGARARD